KTQAVTKQLVECRLTRIAGLCIRVLLLERIRTGYSTIRPEAVIQVLRVKSTQFHWSLLAWITAHCHRAASTSRKRNIELPCLVICPSVCDCRSTFLMEPVPGSWSPACRTEIARVFR